MSVQDLTNTTWAIDAYVHEFEYYESFNINFTSNGSTYTSMVISFDFDDDLGLISYGTTLVYDYFDSYWVNEAYCTITITGGTDVTNTALIEWLEQHATQQISSSTEFDLSTLSLSVGAHTIRVKAKATGYRDSNFSTSVSYPIYEQLTTPIAVVSGSRLSVSAVAHANGFEVYANDVYKTTRPFALGTNFDLDTLNLATGTYTIKVRCIDNTTGSYYTPSEMVTAGTYTVLPQLDAPTNVSVSGTDATFDEVTNAESYEFFVDGTSIGTYTPPSAQYIVTVSPGYDGAYMLYDGQGADASFLGEVGGYATTSVTVTSGYLYITGGNPSADSYNHTGTLSGGVTLVTNNIPTGVLYAVSGDGSITGVGWGCFVEGTKILLADNTTKNVEDITYDDELLVWNFYEGKLDSAKPCWIMEKRVATEYKKVLLSDGTELKLVGQGDNCHRLFNVTKQQMLYANECVGDEVYKADGSIVTVLSCEKVQETVNYYNLTTEKYLDCFAEGVLTGSRLNNMYHISDMKYDSDERLISEEEEKERWAVRGMEVPK